MSRAVAVACLCAAFAVTLVVTPWSDERVTDLYVYEHNAAAFLDGGLPYRHVFFEYPPLAAPLLALPGLAGTDHDAYRLAFAALMLAFAVGVLLLVRALARDTAGDERLAMAAVALALISLGSSTGATAVLLAIWGVIGTAAPVAWWTWLARTLPQDAEDGGGLMVASIQLAITVGAAAGGLLFDASGYASTFTLAALLLAGSAVAALAAHRAAARSAGPTQEEIEP